MAINLPPKYDPKSVEEPIYRQWIERGYFRSAPSDTRSPYCIVIPPPNITGALHMGHALNNTIQDILIRWKRMQGFEALWLPGTDHAGIATQNVVERELAKDGISRHDLGREEFVNRIWQWRERYGNRIVEQLKRLGFSCDWERQRFTLDSGLSKAVNTVFVRLYNEGLIYRGNYLINWCPRCHTALSDDEVEHRPTNGKLWHLKYPLSDGSGFITVATTRPETMLGDTGVAVHPDDPRYIHLIGKTLRLPFVNREIPVIADSAVAMDFGTGCVKVTPAHDANDYAMGNRHNLPRVNVMNPDGTINENGGPFTGLDRYECRKRLVAQMASLGLLEKEADYDLSLSECYRCHSAIEPYLSDQWFVKMHSLAQPAIEAAKSGAVKFHPDRWVRVYLDWLENVRDWCISRQLWWGHPIPVWYCDNCRNIIAATSAPTKCDKCGGTSLTQDPDVLDTWFSSALWPFSTLGWPEETPEVKYYYPTDVLVTDRGIIYFWVARMVMMGYKFMGREPFGDVLIHGTILDEVGRRMSKSLGNGIDPIEMIEQYGADALRFSLVMLTLEGQDVKLSTKKFEMGRNFTNKIWNAVRFALMKMPEGLATEKPLDLSGLQLYDKWILTRLSQTIEVATAEQGAFRLNPAISAIYSFFWNDLCDWYLEAIKADLQPEAPAARRETASRVFLAVLDAALRLLHPYMPYLTEELWHRLAEFYPVRDLSGSVRACETIMLAPWPVSTDFPRFAREAEEMELLKTAVSAVRNVRGSRNIMDKVKLTAMFDAGCAENLSALESSRDLLLRMANLKSFQAGVGVTSPPGSATEIAPPLTLFVPLGELVDVEAERAKLSITLERQRDGIMRLEARLANPEFAAKAPANIVEKEHARLADMKATEAKIVREIKALEMIG
ncbi:MAG: valine--tRNA ligase [Candidatus Brocadiia bacterium]